MGDIPRGLIGSQRHVEYDTWVHCGKCAVDFDASLPPRPFTSRALYNNGWIFTRHFGWICDACASALKTVRR